MSTISRFINRTTIVAAAVLAGSVAVPSAARAAVEQDDQQRSVLSFGVDACPGSADGGAISVGYDDLVDGHTPQQVTEVLADQSGELWRTNEIHHVDGDYFNVHSFPASAAIPITDESVFTYSVTITYEDGVTQTQEVVHTIAHGCDPDSPTTTAPAPSTTAPVASRFDLPRVEPWCNGDAPPTGRPSIEFGYEEAADGHRPIEYHFRLAVSGAVVHDQAGPHGLSGEDGEIAGWFVPGEFGVSRLEAKTYTLTLWVRYEDGVVVSDSLSYDVAAECDDVGSPATTRPSSSPTTAQPSGTLPQTGSSMTIGIAAVGGLLSVAGAALLAGVRRRKSL